MFKIPSSVNGVELSSLLISLIGINRATSLANCKKTTTSLMHQVSTSSVHQVSTSVHQVSTLSVDQVSTSLVNIVSTLITPTSCPQPSDYNREKSQVPLSWPIGVGLLLFTNFITIIMLIISCLLLLRSKGRNEKL